MDGVDSNKDRGNWKSQNRIDMLHLSELLQRSLCRNRFENLKHVGDG